MRRKMTKFCLNDTFKNMKLLPKRASSSDQIKSSMFFSLQFYIQVVEVLHYVAKNPPVSLYRSLEKVRIQTAVRHLSSPGLAFTWFKK